MHENAKYQVVYNLIREISTDMQGVSVKYKPIANKISALTFEGKWEEIDWTPELVHKARLASYDQLIKAITTDDKPFVSTK